MGHKCPIVVQNGTFMSMLHSEWDIPSLTTRISDDVLLELMHQSMESVDPAIRLAFSDLARSTGCEQRLGSMTRPNLED